MPLPIFLFAVLLSVPSDLTVLSVPPAEAAPDYSTTTLKAFAIKTAKEHKLNVGRFVATMQCESNFQWDATSSTNDYGVAQINLPAHPEVSKDLAFDPYYSLTWAAQQWSAGNATAWVCFNRLFSWKGELRE